MLYKKDDTICAIATAPGEGAIAVIRISGTSAKAVAKIVAPFLPENPESHRVYYGFLRKINSEDIIDEVLVTYFHGQRSFTGEDSVEVSCHGSPAIAHEIIIELIQAGARLAERGEFTFRAFMNGRIDLTQAEAVLSLIQSQSAQATRQSIKLLRGDFSMAIQAVEEQLLWSVSRLEANIDFSAEDIEFAAMAEITNKINLAKQSVSQLLGTYSSGKILKSGLRVALVGAPNVGKSSLLNALVNENRVIVSHLPGTTRDSVEIILEIAGHKVVVVDTAGLRLSHDDIEIQGMQRTHEEISQADLVLFIYDGTDLNTKNVYELLNKKNLENKKIFFVANKADSFTERSFSETDIYVSALTKHGVDALKAKIAQHLTAQFYENATVVLSTRQFELLSKMEHFLITGLDLISSNASPEFVISELQEALVGCMELLGKRFDDEVLDRIFNDFCLGK